jgi:hypothetical protein
MWCGRNCVGRWLATHRRSTMAGNALERHHFKLGNKICKGRSGNLLERSGFERFARNLVRCGIRRLTLVSCTKLLIPYEAIALLKHNIKRMLSQLRYMKDVAFDRLSRAQSAILMQRSRSAIRAALRTWMRYAANRWHSSPENLILHNRLLHYTLQTGAQQDFFKSRVRGLRARGYADPAPSWPLRGL